MWWYIDSSSSSWIKRLPKEKETIHKNGICEESRRRGGPMASMSAAQNRTPAGIALPQTEINWDRYYLSVSTFLIWCEEASGRRVWSIMKTGLTHHEEGFEASWIRVWSIVNNLHEEGFVDSSANRVFEQVHEAWQQRILAHELSSSTSAVYFWSRYWNDLDSRTFYATSSEMVRYIYNYWSNVWRVVW